MISSLIKEMAAIPAITTNTDAPSQGFITKPNANPAAKTFQAAMLEQGIPITAFESDDVDADYARLKAKGVAFTEPPKQAGTVKIAIFADTCGNLIQLYQNEG